MVCGRICKLWLMVCGWICGNRDMHLKVLTHHCCSGAMAPTILLFSFLPFWQFFKVRVGSHFLFATRFATLFGPFTW